MWTCTHVLCMSLSVVYVCTICSLLLHSLSPSPIHWMCVFVCVCLFAHTCKHAYLHVLLQRTNPDTGFPTEPAVGWQLANPGDPPASSTLHSAEVTGSHPKPHLVFYISDGDLNSDPHTSSENTLTLKTISPVPISHIFQRRNVAWQVERNEVLQSYRAGVSWHPKPAG